MGGILSKLRRKPTRPPGFHTSYADEVDASSQDITSRIRNNRNISPFPSPLITATSSHSSDIDEESAKAQDTTSSLDFVNDNANLSQEPQEPNEAPKTCITATNSHASNNDEDSNHTSEVNHKSSELYYQYMMTNPFMQNATELQLNELIGLLEERLSRTKLSLNPFRSLPFDCFLVISSFLEAESLASFKQTSQYNHSLIASDRVWNVLARQRGLPKLGVEPASSWMSAVKVYAEKRRKWIELDPTKSLGGGIITNEVLRSPHYCDIIGETLVCSYRDQTIIKYSWSKLLGWTQVWNSILPTTVHIFKCLNENRIAFFGVGNSLSIINCDSSSVETLGLLRFAPRRMKICGRYVVVLSVIGVTIWNTEVMHGQSALVFQKDFIFDVWRSLTIIIRN
jgi:hypothetical protein